MPPTLSLDWGGTTIKAALWIDADTAPVFVTVAGGNLRAAGAPDLDRLLQPLLEKLPPVARSAACRWVIGAAGAQDHDRERICQARHTGGVRPQALKLYQDFQANHAACFAGASGILSVNGTGSIRFGRNGGLMKRLGGWGYLLEETPGAAVCGRLALQGALAFSEGDVSAAALAEHVGTISGTAPGNRDELLAWAYSRRQPQTDLGSLAPAFTTACTAGCEWSLPRMKRLFETWSTSMRQLAVEVKLTSPVPWVGLGGLWNAWPAFSAQARQSLERDPERRWEQRTAAYDSAWGPLILDLLEESRALPHNVVRSSSAGSPP